MFPWILALASCERNNVTQNKLESTKQKCEAINWEIVARITPELRRTGLYRLDMFAMSSIEGFQAHCDYCMHWRDQTSGREFCSVFGDYHLVQKFTVWSGVPEVFGGAILVWISSCANPCPDKASNLVIGASNVRWFHLHLHQHWTCKFDVDCWCNPRSVIWSNMLSRYSLQRRWQNHINSSRWQLKSSWPHQGSK